MDYCRWSTLAPFSRFLVIGLSSLFRCCCTISLVLQYLGLESCRTMLCVFRKENKELTVLLYVEYSVRLASASIN